MTTYFVDTSALAKRYIPETGSEWMTDRMVPSSDHIILVSGLSSVEFVSMLVRRERERFVSNTDRIRLENDFLFHLQHQYLVIAITENVLAEARRLLETYPLRTLDAIQLASANHVNSVLDLNFIFVSADNRLLQAAVAEGFVTENPNNYG